MNQHEGKKKDTFQSVLASNQLESTHTHPTVDPPPEAPTSTVPNNLKRIDHPGIDHIDVPPTLCVVSASEHIRGTVLRG
jgi:hypothetical protein